MTAGQNTRHHEELELASQLMKALRRPPAPSESSEAEPEKGSLHEGQSTDGEYLTPEGSFDGS